MDTREMPKDTKEKKVIFYVENGSCYLEIVQIKYSGTDYMNAHVKWYSRPGRTFLFEEKNLKIRSGSIDTWKTLDG